MAACSDKLSNDPKVRSSSQPVFAYLEVSVPHDLARQIMWELGPGTVDVAQTHPTQWLAALLSSKQIAQQRFADLQSEWYGS